MKEVTEAIGLILSFSGLALILFGILTTFFDKNID